MKIDGKRYEWVSVVEWYGKDKWQNYYKKFYNNFVSKLINFYLKYISTL